MSMLRSAVLGIVCIAGLIAPAWAELKIGFINSEKIFLEYEGTKEAQDKFNKEVAKWEQEASTRKKEIQSLKEKLESQSLLLSSAKKKEIENQLRQKVAEYQQFLQEKIGPRGAAQEKNEELTKPIIERINGIIDKIAREEKYDFIYDVKSGGIIFAKAQYDLTERVITILNKE